jgi:probable HAF family extracellular repeat protein
MGFIAHPARKSFAFSFLTALAVIAPAQGAAVYTILDVGTLGRWGSLSETPGYNNVLNASGQVVGDSNPSGSTYHAFRTAPNGPIIQGPGGSDLGTLGGIQSRAYGINDSGQAVGVSYSTDHTEAYAFRTTAKGPIVPGADGSDLGSLGGTQSFAYGINNSGQAVGYSRITGGPFHAFRTAPNGPIVQGEGGSDLGTLGGTSSAAGGINDSGQAVGNSYITGNVAQHAFRTAPNGPIVQGEGGSDLGTLGGRDSAAFSINASGQAVGTSYMTTTGLVTYHAFRTAPNGPIVPGPGGSDLGTLGGTQSEAFGINTLGQTVGYAYTTSEAEHAFFADVTGPWWTSIRSSPPAAAGS